MKTIKDIIDIVIDDMHIDRSICNTYGHIYCDSCSKHFTWCYIDSFIVSLDYLLRGDYYG